MKWTPEAEAALQDLKRYLSSTPTLVAPKPQEPLLLYLAATNQVVSAALVAQRELEEETAAAAEPSDDGPGHSPTRLMPARWDPRQGPIPARQSLRRWVELNRRRRWCSTRSILSVPSCRGARSRYSAMQKLLFGLLMASRKLRHYFQAHEITVVTRLPLQQILHNPDATGRIVEWALELSSFGLKFESTSKIKS